MVRLGQPHAVPVARMAPQARPVQAHPQQVLRVGRIGDQRPFHLHGEVEARRREAVRGVEIVVVVDDVDAADEGNASIHDGDLPMQPSQAAARWNQALARTASTVIALPKPSSTTRTFTPRLAAAARHSSTRNPVRSSMKM
ncbi:hypothetical protein G6F63_014747 [Rhizopus arrhizus]|nr:hypothetical protein G6F63_014747 [Rhizopus arrhizus]